MPGLGRQIVLRAFERAGKKFSEDKLRPALPRLARSNIDDVLAAVGRGEMFSGDVVKAVYPDFKEERKTPAPDRTDPGWFRMQKASGVQFKAPGATSDAQALPIRGLQGDLPVSFAPNGAVPGDRIVGIMTPGKGITVYPIQSPGARRLRRPARALARRALGRRGRAGRCSRRGSWSRRSTSRAASAPWRA